MVTDGAAELPAGQRKEEFAEPRVVCWEGPAIVAVAVDGVTRVFQSGRPRSDAHRVVALDQVTLRIEEGEVHGLLGPNGAGKTTLIRILSTVLLPTSGTASILGHDVVRETRLVRPLIGIVFGGERGLYQRLTARQNLRYWGALYNIPETESRRRADKLLERLGLADRADARVETFSRGMKQRLHLARGLMGDPRVLFLDEPTAGMDPIASRDFRTLVRELQAENRTILLATHDMIEAELLCDRVSLIDRGRLIAVERPKTLATWITRYERIVVGGAAPAVLERVHKIDGVRSITINGDGTARIDTGAAGATKAVLEYLIGAGVTTLSTSLPSLEEVYLEVIGRREPQT